MPKKAKPKQKRRARGTGTLVPDPRGAGWLFKVPVGRYPSGRTQYTEVRALTQVGCIEKAKLVQPPGPGTTVSEWADRWLTGVDVRDSTRADYAHTVAKYVKPTLGHFRVRDLTSGDVERAVKKWRKDKGTTGLGPNTAKKNFGHLVTMLDAARRSGIGTNVAADAPRPKAKRVEIDPFDRGELDAIISAAVAHPADRPFAVLATVGCRLGEVLALDVPDFAAGVISITKTWSGKHGIRPPKSENGIRTVRVPAQALPAIVGAIGSRKSGVLFASSSGGRRHHTSLQRRWKTFLAALGIRYRNVHQLRHSVATAMSANRVQVGDIAKYLGDTVETIVRRYLKPAGGDPAAAMEAFLRGASGT